MEKIKIYAKSIFIPVVTGTIVGILTSQFIDYNTLQKPPLSPPSILFPIAWTILYILMGISIYRIDKTNSNKKSETKLIYFIQLVINALWTPIFFGLKEYFLAFLWILMLILLVVTMMILFFKIDKISSYLNIPYILWLLFAAYLNFGIFVLN